MSIFFNILTVDVLPIFLIASVGVTLVRTMKVDVTLITKVGLAVFFPCLIFNSLVNTNIDLLILKKMFFFGVLYYSLVLVMNGLIGIVSKQSADMRRVFMISTSFSNIGNYGLPLVIFVYGNEAAAYATIILIMNNFLMNTIGILIVSSNTSNQLDALRNVAKTPLVYAVLAGLVVSFTKISVPLPLSRTIGLLGNAAIPVMLLVLGMQLRKVPWQQIRQVSLGVVSKLMLSPALAAILVLVLGLTGAPAKDGILMAAMPTPIIATAIATQYSSESTYVVNMCAVTTLLSLITLTTLIAILR